MEEGKKKTVMLILIVGCLVVAGAVTFTTRSGGGGIGSISKSEKILVMCSNPDCEAEYETGKKAYYEFVQKNMNPMSMAAPPMPCNECGEESIYKAIKCGKCGTVFFENSVPNDFADRCPECEYSEIDERRKERRAERNKD